MMNTRENRGTQVKGIERKEVKIMKNIINTIKEFIGLDTILISVALAFIFGIMFAGISAQNEVSYTDTEKTFRTECYEKFEKAMDYIYSEDYSEENIKLAKVMACNSFISKAENNEELISEIIFPALYVEGMIKKFEERYNFEHNIYPFYTEDASFGIYYNMPEAGHSMFEFTHKTAPKSRIAQIMDDLEAEFSKDHIIERDGNSMYIEPIEVEQKLVSIKDVEKPVVEQKLELVSIKYINE